MIAEEYSFTSKDNDGTRIHGVRWEPDGEKKPVAVLNIVHGMIEYIERYEDFARYLCDKGFAVCGHDHIGHGGSVADPSEWGQMHAAKPSDVLVEDMLTDYELAREHYGNVPIFILGHSMGSYLLRKFLSVYNDRLLDLSGAIIMGTGSESDAAIKAGAATVQFFMRLRGKNYVSHTIKNMMYNEAYRKFDLSGEDPSNSWLTKDEELVKEYETNPKTSFEFSLNAYKALLDTVAYDNSLANIKKIRTSLPVLFVSGTEDPVGNMGEGVRMAFQKFWDAGISDLGIELYEGYRHEILNEIGRERVYDDLYSWMSERM